MTTSISRTAAAVIALSMAAFVLPTTAHAKRLGGGARSIPPSSIGKAPAKPMPPATPQAPAAPAAPAAAAAPAPAAAAAPAARGPSMMGTMGAA
ncbi:MAG TPA: ABC transporter substrate-binding protein, partial [Giesbergeria sp.]|nr:ABC transporter substrate-binding protein [Giesbergeria sp.]